MSPETGTASEGPASLISAAPSRHCHPSFAPSMGERTLTCSVCPSAHLNPVFAESFPQSEAFSVDEWRRGSDEGFCLVTVVF